MKKFRRDLAVGGVAEKLVENLFQQHGFSTWHSEPGHKEYDIGASAGLSLHQNIMVEVKYDIYAARSGNIAIEFYNSKLGEASGIDATEADIWAHVLSDPHSIWFSSVKKLKEFIKSNKPFRVITAGGDDNASMYLYKKDFILPSVFHRVDGLTKDEFLQVLGGELC